MSFREARADVHPATSPRRGRGRRVLTNLTLLLGGLVAGVLLLEVLLQLTALVVGGQRAMARLPGDRWVILCVGDSHTYGLGKGYPTALGRRLAERSPGYRVINLGVPGSNTAQLRNRFIHYLETYAPIAVIHWAGVNNAYNRAETGAWREADVPDATWGEWLSDHVRIVRFFRVWRRDAQLRSLLDQAEPTIVSQIYRDPKNPAVRRRRGLEEHDVLSAERSDPLAPAEQARVTALDVGWMAAEAKRRGVPMILITYPLWGGWFGAANQGIRQVAETAGVPLVEGPDSVSLIEERYKGHMRDMPPLFDKSVHPTEPLYDAIAQLVLQRLDQERLLPP